MKILEITCEAPGERSGGALGVKQSIESLLSCGQVDYIGPPIMEKVFEYKDFNVVAVLKENKSAFYRIWLLLKFGVTSSFYSSWHKIVNEIEWEDYDIVHIEFTREKFLIHTVKEKNKCAVSRIHNVEMDYYRNLYNEKKSLKSFLKYFFAKRQEKYIVSLADRLFCLTEHDKQRIIEAYSVDARKIDVIPVCIDKEMEKNEIFKPNKDDDILSQPYFLITGSLWYGANFEGCYWFIDTVWRNLQKNDSMKNYNLICAGANPNKKILELVKDVTNVYLVDSPISIKKYFFHAAAYIAPIFRGAGMKVKIAESLSYGLNIVGTPHAVLGYKVPSKGIYIATDIKSFEKQILFLVNHMLLGQHSEIKKFFDDNYSIEYSRKSYQSILRNLL